MFLFLLCVFLCTLNAQFVYWTLSTSSLSTESITYVEYTWPRALDLVLHFQLVFCAPFNWHIALSNVNNANGYRVAAELHVNPPVKQINSSNLQYTTTVDIR